MGSLPFTTPAIWGCGRSGDLPGSQSGQAPEVGFKCISVPFWGLSSFVSLPPVCKSYFTNVEMGGPEKSSDFFKVTQLPRGRSRSQTQSSLCLQLHSSFFAAAKPVEWPLPSSECPEVNLGSNGVAHARRNLGGRALGTGNELSC